MACSSCRSATPFRVPSSASRIKVDDAPVVGNVLPNPKSVNASGPAHSKITGLHYAPKGR